MRTRFVVAVAAAMVLEEIVRSVGAQAGALPPGFREEIVVSGLS